MPLVRYEIRSAHSLANPDLYRSAKDEPEGHLEGVAAAGLVGIVRQIGDLADFAAEIFRDLHEEVIAVASRSHDLGIRVQQIEAEMSSVEKALLSETNQLKFAYNRGTEWHATIRTDQNHCSQGDFPRFIRNSYEECRGPPKLFLLDRFDVAGAGACLKRYTDPSYFKTEWASSELMKAEQAQRENQARRGKKKGRRRKGNELVDSIPVTQINSRARYSSRGVETDVASGSSSSLNSEYLAKQRELLPTDSEGASPSSSSKESRAPLSTIRGQETGAASRSSAPVSTEHLKQPRVALPPSRVVHSSRTGSGSPLSLPSAEHVAKPARQPLPPSLQEIEGVSSSSTLHQIAVRSREALPPSLGLGESVEVPSPNSVGSMHSRQVSEPKVLSPAIATDEPLKLNAKEIEAESLSGRFVSVQHKPSVETVQEIDTEHAPFRWSDEQALSASPGQCPSEQPPASLQGQPVRPDEQALDMQAALDYDEIDRSEQKGEVDPGEDLAGEVDNFVDALATMDSDGETDAETRTSESRPRVDADADADDDEVQSKLAEQPPGNGQDAEESASVEVLIKTQPDLVSPSPPKIEVSYPKVLSPSPLNAELLFPGHVVLSGKVPSSPTESNAWLSPSNRTVDSAELISPSESSCGLSSPGTFPVVGVTPRSAIADKVEVVLSGEVPSSPTESNARLSPSNRTVDSAELISPSESSWGPSSPGTFSDVVVTPRSTAMADKVEESETTLGLSPPGHMTAPSGDSQTAPQVLSCSAPGSMLHAPLKDMGEATGLPSSAGTSLPGEFDVRPPSPSRFTATPPSPGKALSPPSLLVGHTASDSGFDSVRVPVIDLPSPSGTVIVLPSPSIVGRAPWDLSSPAGSTSELSTPRKVEGYAHDFPSPVGSTSDTSSLYKVQSPPGLNLGVSNLEEGTVPTRDLPSPLGSTPSIGKESESYEHSAVLTSSQTALKETSELVTVTIADDILSPTAEAEAEHQYLPPEASENMQSVARAVTEYVSQVEQGNSSRTGPGAGFAEELLLPTKESTDEVLDNRNRVDENFACQRDISAHFSDEDIEALEKAVVDKENDEGNLIPADPLLHLLSSEEDPEDELDEELVEAAGSQHLPVSPSPPSSPSPRAHKFSVLDPLSLSDTEAKDPGSSPRGSEGSSPRSSVFSAINSPMSPPLQSRKLMKSPETKRGRSFRASEVVSPLSPTHGSKLQLPRSPPSQALPEMLPLLPPMNPGQWQGASAYHERRHSLPVEFVRSPARVQPTPPVPLNRDVQTNLATVPMPTRRAPVPGQQSVIDAVAVHDKSKLKKVPRSLQSLQSPIKLSPMSDGEVLLQQIRTQSFSLRDTNSVPRVVSESPQRPITNINVAAILEKANAIRQALTGSDEDDDEYDHWSDK